MSSRAGIPVVAPRPTPKPREPITVWRGLSLAERIKAADEAKAAKK